ncbi:MAG: FlgD immunoglobulin-like domain containing protein [Candidatus Krumholzibacteriia bacterium]
MKTLGTWTERAVLGAAAFICCAIGFGLHPDALAQECVDYTDQPQLLATLPLTAGDAVEVATLRGAAYVLVEDLGFVVVDWTVPSAPQAGDLISVGGARSLAVGTAALYVLGGEGQLTVFDLADPLAPAALGEVGGLADANDLCVADDVAYLVLAAGGLQVVDLADPLAPVAGAQVPLADGNRAVAVLDDRAFVVGIGHLEHDFGAFYVVDLTDPVLPTVLGAYVSDGTGWGWMDRYHDVCAGPGGVFVVHESSWYDGEADYNYRFTDLRAFDCTDPAHPVPGARLIRGREAMAAVCIGDVAAAAVHESGPQDPWCPDCFWDDLRLDVKRCDDDSSAEPLSSLPLPAEPRDLTWGDGHLLVACGEAGLAVVAAPMLAPGHPDPLDAVFPPYRVAGEVAALAGDRLATSIHHEGGCSPGDESYIAIMVWDVANGQPHEPVVTWAQPYGGNCSRLLFVGGNYLYADNRILEIGDDLTDVGAIPGGCAMEDLAGGYLVGRQGLDLGSWDIGDPGAPVPVSVLPLGGIKDLQGHGDRVYVATNDDVRIVAVAGDGSLSEVASLLPGCTPRSVCCDGSQLVVGGLDGRLLVYEVSDPDNPSLQTELDLGGSIVDLALGTQLYAAVADRGWAVVEVFAGGSGGVLGWVDGEQPREVHADGDRLVLVNACPLDTWVTAQACPREPVAAPGTDPATAAEAHVVLIEDAWPNPANPRLSVTFALRRPERVQVEIIDVAGHRVTTLAAGRFEAGHHTLRWDGRGAAGQAAPSGVYLVRVEAGGDSSSRKVVLTR